ncbi:Rne/Rng family ribonuclease [Leptolyngbya sp. FACHB-261]|uniref:Rne/Rng family ribonuclease n=1 Tax=Leptolyngbya sp. FACHB-261 TaxID=2692806 RepID=UPI0016843FC6|nr:Rne/Rng family ribonuclease [Leptolyngbya sp. FACHB-261]MBD2100704.1 Rne/Rng family ribonuclease [Leptolyngbya sp. FACHB-261]
MSKQIIIAEQHRTAAVFSEDQIQELIVAKGSHQVGDVYLGVVENVLPSIDAAFVNIGDSERNGFIHVSDLGPLRLKRIAASITELVAPQQKVLVQIMKEPTGNKGPRLTGNITLPGRYLVLMPFGRGVNLSRRIRSENERNRLRALAILIKPAGMGLLVRTEAEEMTEEAIMEDLDTLMKSWETIQQEATTTRAPALLNRDDDFIQRVLRDVYSADVNRIVVDSSTGLKRVKQYLTNWSAGKPPTGVFIDHHRDRAPILEYFRVNAAIREALRPRVDLPSGGYIIIEPTEALTVIDVNSGSFTRSATSRETVLWTNCEAATEIARQLRLRNIAGVIIVDFIDMDARRDQLQVLEHFSKALKADKSRPQIAQLTELGLIELTRKRQGQSIYELFGRPCNTCAGLGYMVHLPGDLNGEGESLERMVSSSPRPTFREREPREREPRENREFRDFRPITQENPPRTQPAQVEPTEDFDLSENDDRELDLGGGPGYPDRGANGNRRRRRRRDGFRENGSRENGLPPSIPSLQNGRSEPPSGVEERPEPPRTDTPTSRPEPLRIDRPREPEPVEARREDPRPRPEPPEQITVEMTEEEQDLYALMGISPVVLAPPGLKNPRTAVVTVALPGEPPRPLVPPVTTRSEPEPIAQPSIPASNISAPIGEEAETEPIAAPSPLSPVQASPVQSGVPVSAASDLTPGDETTTEEVQSSELAFSTDTSVAEDSADDVDAAGGPPRRRRRRSSARG